MQKNGGWTDGSTQGEARNTAITAFTLHDGGEREVHELVNGVLQSQLSTFTS